MLSQEIGDTTFAVLPSRKVRDLLSRAFGDDREALEAYVSRVFLKGPRVVSMFWDPLLETRHVLTCKTLRKLSRLRFDCYKAQGVISEDLQKYFTSLTNAVVSCGFESGFESRHAAFCVDVLGLFVE
jgi:hypothetical protein